MKINHHQYHHDSTGFSAVGMVLILLLLGSLLIYGLSQSSLFWQKSFIYQKHYYSDVNRALSAIQWATSQSWSPPNPDWLCQTEITYQLNACIKQSSLSNGNYVILKGQSNQLIRYHLAGYDNGSVTIEKGHWLDYCPEKGSLACD